MFQEENFNTDFDMHYKRYIQNIFDPDLIATATNVMKSLNIGVTILETQVSGFENM